MMRSLTIALACLSAAVGCSDAPSRASNGCTTNLVAIYFKLRAWEGDGIAFPASFATLTNAPPSLFVCPSSGHQSGAITNVDAWTDYIYVPNTWDGLRHDLAVVICPPENHGGKYGHVLFGGSWIERLPAAQIRALIDEPWSRPSPGRAKLNLGPNGTEIPFDVWAKTNVSVHVPERFRSIYPGRNN